MPLDLIGDELKKACVCVCVCVCVDRRRAEEGLQESQSHRAPRQKRRYSVYLLFWYKSTNTDVQGAAGSNTRFQAVAAAYETLSDADRKEAYDAASDIRRELQQVCCS